MRRSRLPRRTLSFASAIALALTATFSAPAQAQEPDEGTSGLRALLYGEADSTDLLDPVARLALEVEAGRVVLPKHEEWGYLPAVLEALDVPVESQTLVFSRTSLQVDNIAPWAPRALYFNDDVYIGYTMLGLVLEIASVDPDGGSVFYTVDQLDDTPEFRADDLTCEGCHTTAFTRNVPGVFMRSFVVDQAGHTLGPVVERAVDDRTPMEDRFGGWYVTGTHSLPHAGNVMADVSVYDLDDPWTFSETVDMSVGGNRTELEGFDPTLYMGEGSDIVALLVLAHQTQVHNQITRAARAAEEARRDLALAELAARRTGGVARLSEASERDLDRAADALLQAMLFYKAAPIGSVSGSAAFVESFEAHGPFDGEGRTLRQLALDGQLFRYPLSFLIYSEAWDALPPMILDRTYRRLDQLLARPDHPDFPLLDEASRAAIREILEETKPDFVAALESADLSTGS